MLSLARPVYDEIAAHARAGAPREACGVLGGEFGDERSHVHRHDRAENVADRPRRAYALDPEEQFALMEGIEDEGHEVVGFYHSHPRGPPVPSAADEAEATWEGYSYVIVSLGGEEPYVGSWRWTGTAFRREAVALRRAP